MKLPKINGTKSYIYAFYDENKELISEHSQIGTDGDYTCITIPSTAYYIRFNARSASYNRLPNNDIWEDIEVKEVQEPVDNSPLNVEEITGVLDENEQYADEPEFEEETEGLTDAEIADALRFYKEMKKRVKGDK